MRLLTLAFTQSDLEERFRQDNILRDVRLSTRLLALSVVFQLVSIPADIGILNGPALVTVVALRALGIFSAIAALGSINNGESSRTFDITITGWMLIVTGEVLMASAVLPADYSGQVPWHVLLVLGAYCVPVPLLNRVAVAGLISVGNVIMFIGFKDMAWPAVVDLAAAFACANFIGLFAANEVGLWSRERFTAAMEAEEKARELKELQKIIPVCSSCHRVRTDDGYLELVEEFLAAHPDAHASRGICPTCVERLYPTLAN